MLNSIATALSQIASLADRFQKGRWERFNAIATPLLTELRQIHADYVSMFREVELELATPTTELEQVVVRFARARERLAPNRIELRHAIEVANASSKVDPFRPLFDALLRWLLAFSYQQGESSISSMFYSVLSQAACGQSLENLKASSVREDLALQAEANIVELEAAWSEVARSYHAVKVQLVR
jgi:hypothetical protein